MSRPRIQIIPHLDESELAQCYETCENSKTKTYWLAIQLLSRSHEPMTVEQVAETLEFSTDWVRKLAGRYNRLGPSGLLENNHKGRKNQAAWRSQANEKLQSD
ncbi:MAG: hypothetical protein KME10_29645 [Plectolyngbya sp. WJT66-NPBG17]|jgi:predicted transcriptional regulator of viral defense system|nr:hypothetical protein [Plectolyngbya sp. WJT66-NPBG17]MBW4529006.1 hypothetical protein [Phormidium tanganyikae FI6-MK23]